MGFGGWVVGFDDWVVESVVGLWEMVSGLWVVWVWERKVIVEIQRKVIVLLLLGKELG